MTNTISLSFFVQDLQFIIKLSFRTFWYLRTKNPLPSKKPEMSVMEIIEYFHKECKDTKFLEEEDCKFLIIMDALDCYQAPLDWEVSHLHTYTSTLNYWQLISTNQIVMMDTNL